MGLLVSVVVSTLCAQEAEKPSVPAAFQEPDLILPDGTPMKLWDDETVYSTTFHVAQGHPEASDDNPGTAEKPWKTIGKAAAVLQPGEEVVIHGGIYRETVRPVRGGTGPDAMIRYRAAEDAEVLVSGRDPLTGDIQKAGEFAEGLDNRKHRNVYTVPLPMERFGIYNPFAMTNLSSDSYFPFYKRPFDENWRILKRRGQIYQGERTLEQIGQGWQFGSPGRYMIQDPGVRLFFQLHENADPASEDLYISVREQCFNPMQPGLGYIRVQGLTLAYATNGVPWPQKGAISTWAGHHWILEDLTIRDCHAVGMDLGAQNRHAWRRKDDDPRVGGHIVRNNHIYRCGISGICGTVGTKNLLVMNNLIEDIGDLDLEYAYESAAIKLHTLKDSIVTGNRIRNIRHAAGIWIDYAAGNSRISRNVITDVQTLLGGIYIEANNQPIWVDGNVIWDMRDEPDNDPPKDDMPGGYGISVDITNKCSVFNNFLGDIQGHAAIGFHAAQRDRGILGQGVSASRDNHAYDNVVIGGQKMWRMMYPERNRVASNWYDARKIYSGFQIDEANRLAAYGLADWRALFNHDTTAVALWMNMKYDDDEVYEAWRFRMGSNDERPRPERIEPSDDADGYTHPGPFDATTWEAILRGDWVTFAFSP